MSKSIELSSLCQGRGVDDKDGLHQQLASRGGPSLANDLVLGYFIKIRREEFITLADRYRWLLRLACERDCVKSHTTTSEINTSCTFKLVGTSILKIVLVDRRV